MAQTRHGAIKVAAARAGVTAEVYERQIAAGRKWCVLCRAWHERAAFGLDRTRYDGLASSCIRARGAKARAIYVRRPRPTPGRSFVPPRDGDKRQAKRRINYFVEAGLLPSPNSLPCSDCGHIWRPRGWRHEYHHDRGYAAEHHEHVIALCSRCHHRRHDGRQHKD